MREQRVRICIQEIRRSKAPQLLRECGHGGKPLVERRDLVWPHPQLRHPIEKHAKRLLRIGLADGVEPGGPEPRRSENAGKPAVMRKQVHAPGKLARERLRIAIGPFPHGRPSHVGHDNVASQIVATHDSVPFAVGGRISLLEQAHIRPFVVGNTPPVTVRSRKSAVLGKLRQ